MSTNVIVNFYLNGKEKVGNEVCLNKLKDMLEGWSWGEELVPIGNPDVKDAGICWYEDFLQYILAEDVPDNLKGRIVEKDGHREIHLKKSEDFSVESREPSIEEIEDSEFFNKKYIRVFNWKSEEHNGNWFDIDSFYNAKLMNEKCAATTKVELAKLVAMKDSIEYYKLMPEQKEALCEDIDFHTDILQSYEDKIYICQYMIDTLEMMAEMYGKNYSDKCICFVYLS